MATPEFVTNAISNNCCQCWLGGCGLNGTFGAIADCLELVTPVAEQIGNIIWIFGSPLAFPIIFCFPSAPHTAESSGYEISMIEAPVRHPCICAASTICLPCGQWYVRRAVLNYDMTKYKLWQGYHDGPHCFARYCDGAPITIRSGTYGEQNCPNLFLCLEVSVLGCYWSSCCSFDVSRRYQREERGLSIDPTEQRHRSCIDFFSRIMHHCCMLGMCVGCSSYCVGLCSPDSVGAQECAGDGGRAARACCRIAHILWKGIMWTRVIGIGCMTTQMIHEADTPYDKLIDGPKAKPEFLIHKPPQKETMDDRGDNDNDNVTQSSGNTTEISDMKFPWESKNNENRNNHQQPTSRPAGRGGGRGRGRGGRGRGKGKQQHANREIPDSDAVANITIDRGEETKVEELDHAIEITSTNQNMSR
jgi:hypothetical protein